MPVRDTSFVHSSQITSPVRLCLSYGSSDRPGGGRWRPFGCAGTPPCEDNKERNSVDGSTAKRGACDISRRRKKSACISCDNFLVNGRWPARRRQEKAPAEAGALVPEARPRHRECGNRGISR